MVIQNSFVKEGFVVTYNQIALLRFWEHQILKANQKSQNRTFHYKWGLTTKGLHHEANATTF